MPPERDPGLPPAKASSPQLTAAVVSDDEIRRRRLLAILQEGGLEVAQQCSAVEGMSAAAGPADLRAVVLGWERVDTEAIYAIGVVRAAFPDAALVGVAARATPRALRDVLASGADGLVLEAHAGRALVSAVLAVRSGQVVIPRELRAQLGNPALTPREKQVLGMVVLRFTNGEIARKLHVTESTVKSHLSAVFDKLGVRSRNEVVPVLVGEPSHGSGVVAVTDGGQGRRRPVGLP